MALAPVIWWVRRDLRLDDNPALAAALALGRPVIPVAILDPETEILGAAPLWRWGLGLEALSAQVAEMGARLILRRGSALAVLRALVAETGARDVLWSRLYDPDNVARDKAVKAGLVADGIAARSLAGHLLFEPWAVETKTGGFYRVYTPFWKAVRDRPVAAPEPGPSRWPGPAVWPTSEGLADWDLARRMDRGAAIVRPHQRVGEAAALDQLDRFARERIALYKVERDFPGIPATSGLSAALSLGEISPRRCWHRGQAAMAQGAAGAEHFLKELVWREFAYHLVFHTPQITRRNWRPEWDAFPWATEPGPEFRAWQQGRTGIPFVDAAMREMYVTGTMHNRGRMIVASYLTKHLMTHWRLGQAWFAECLTDWDPASNAMGWQWAAGSGPDAAPYFRVFNPDSQAEKFDADQSYRRAWIAEGYGLTSPTAQSYFEAIPRAWGLSPDDKYPDPVVTAAAGRARALDAYQNRTL